MLNQPTDLPAEIIPEGAAGIDAGLTLTKSVARRGGRPVTGVRLTSDDGGIEGEAAQAAVVGVTGARASSLPISSAVPSQEIDAAARGARALLGDAGEFVLALLGTGTAFAAVREGSVQHLGGTALGGGSFAGIARRIAPSLSYDEMIAAAARGDRRNVDLMVSDAYPEGIGRISATLTAAHLARRGDAPLDDTLAGLLNLHAESIAQIGASRAVVARISRLVLAGGFVHGNQALADGMTDMARLFGITVDVVPVPAFAGAIGAALLAAEARLKS